MTVKYEWEDVDYSCDLCGKHIVHFANAYNETNEKIPYRIKYYDGYSKWKTNIYCSKKCFEEARQKFKLPEQIYPLRSCYNPVYYYYEDIIYNPR